MRLLRGGDQLPALLGLSRQVFEEKLQTPSISFIIAKVSTLPDQRGKLLGRASWNNDRDTAGHCKKNPFQDPAWPNGVDDMGQMLARLGDEDIQSLGPERAEVFDVKRMRCRWEPISVGNIRQVGQNLPV